jgi:hypothetical protein
MLYWLIESTNQLKEFYNRNYSEVFLEPIYYNDHVHPSLNHVSALYIKPLNGEKGYILCLSHDETLTLNKTHIDAILRKFTSIYVRDRKSILYFFSNANFTNIPPSLYPYIQPTTNTHNFFYQKCGSKPDINKIIPIVKHYERCELIWESVKDCCINSNKKYLNKLSTVFHIIESNGIKIDPKLFNKFFEPHDEIFSIHDNTIYTQYNLHTTTGRPSNSFNGINFAALKKDNGCRKSFIPRNNHFVEYDLTAYHPSLVAKLIDFDFGNETPYQYFAREAGIDISKAKVEMIKQMYGGVYKEYEHIDFFKKLKVYTNNIWKKFEASNVFEIESSGTIFTKSELKDMNPNKLLSYVIQATETYYNVEMLWEMLKLLKDKNTQIVLYVYDSFLFDVDEQEISIFQDIEQIFTKYNLKYKTKTGINYDLS